MADAVPAPAAPKELLVLAHGLQGTVEDFNYLIEELSNTPAARGGRVLVHASRVNTDKTHDGVVLGGLRLAEDVRSVAAKYPSLESISMMGFSLGGLYVRYAVGHLFQAETETIAGLKPAKVIIVASPNLGVRRFGVYRFLPPSVYPFATVLIGDTGAQLLLQDEEQLMMAMTTDRNKHNMKFVSALRSFPERCIYANVRNDFMVNYGTAALDHTVQMLGGPDVDRIVGTRTDARRESVDEDYDERGCRICFQFRYEEQKEVSGAEEVVEDGKEEEIMSKRLQSIGWKVIGVDFPLAWPIAHNRIVAMSRNAIHTWINASGRRVVHHLVDTFNGGFDEHEPMFRQVARLTD